MDRWTPGWSTDRLIGDADVIDGVPFMRLGDILRWKIAAARPKDHADIAAIRHLYRIWTAMQRHCRLLSQLHRGLDSPPPMKKCRRKEKAIAVSLVSDSPEPPPGC
ncbi:hypothetical protein [Streptomyces sp. NPDC001450]